MCIPFATIQYLEDMRVYRIFIILAIGVLTLAWIGQTRAWKRIAAIHLPKSEISPAIENETLVKARQKVTEARSFLAKKNYTETICFLIDMSLPSGQSRFLVYNLRKDSIQNSALVTHGRCNELWLEGRKYGNTVGCGCTSLGKYRVGKSYYGKFGLAYKLHGLDKTNDKAFERFVVLHAHDCVPETEVKEDICQSDGCPTVSPNFLQYLKPIIDRSEKPVLMWIYE